MFASQAWVFYWAFTAKQTYQIKPIYLRRTTMIKGLTITPPILGRITIGKVVEKTVNAYLKKMTNLLSLAKYKAKTVG